VGVGEGFVEVGWGHGRGVGVVGRAGCFDLAFVVRLGVRGRVGAVGSD
jgi:hypothetical protein